MFLHDNSSCIYLERSGHFDDVMLCRHYVISCKTNIKWKWNPCLNFWLSPWIGSVLQVVQECSILGDERLVNLHRNEVHQNLQTGPQIWSLLTRTADLKFCRSSKCCSRQRKMVLYHSGRSSDNTVCMAASCWYLCILCDISPLVHVGCDTDRWYPKWHWDLTFIEGGPSTWILNNNPEHC